MRKRNLTSGARWMRTTAWLLLTAVLVGAGGRAASADACSSCPEPTEDDIRAADPAYELAVRSGWLGLEARDYLTIDAGECAYALAGPPAISIGKSWLVLRGTGSVWNCPWGRSEDTISFEIESGDSSEWKLDASLEGTLATEILKLLLNVDYVAGKASTVREVRKVIKTLDAGYGHVLDWSGYFELADVICDMDVNVTRRWSWWTKNPVTGYQVHQHGSVWMDCGNEEAQATRRASIGYSIRIIDSSCDDPLAPPIDRGTFPRHLPPVVTPSDDPPVPGNDEGGGEDAPEEPLDPEQPEPRDAGDGDEPLDSGEPRDAGDGEEPRAPEDLPEEHDDPEPPAEPGSAPGTGFPTESGGLGDAPTGTLPSEPEGFGGPTPPGEVPTASAPTATEPTASTPASGEAK
jgi:hypothetical protein